MSKKYIIDRVEDVYAIAQKEDGEMCEISIKDIKGNFKEGDILVKINEHFEIDEVSTQARKKQMEDSVRDMWEE